MGGVFVVIQSALWMGRRERANKMHNISSCQAPMNALQPNLYKPKSCLRLSSNSYFKTGDFARVPAGVKVTDLEGLRRVGAAPGAVAQLVSETFNE